MIEPYRSLCTGNTLLQLNEYGMASALPFCWLAVLNDNRLTINAYRYMRNVHVGMHPKQHLP